MHSLSRQVVQDRAGAPARMDPAHLDDFRLELRGYLMRTGIGPRALVRKRAETASRIPPEPSVDGLAPHPIAPRHVDDGRSFEHSDTALKRCSTSPSSTNTDASFFGDTSVRTKDRRS
jgi:hypothetical protein